MSWIGDQISVAASAYNAFNESIGNSIVGGTTTLVTGRAGTALGNRAVNMVEYQTGQAFTGTTAEYTRFGTAIAGDMVGTNQIVEGRVDTT